MIPRSELAKRNPDWRKLPRAAGCLPGRRLHTRPGRSSAAAGRRRGGRRWAATRGHHRGRSGGCVPAADCRHACRAAYRDQPICGAGHRRPLGRPLGGNGGVGPSRTCGAGRLPRLGRRPTAPCPLRRPATSAPSIGSLGRINHSPDLCRTARLSALVRLQSSSRRSPSQIALVTGPTMASGWIGVAALLACTRPQPVRVG